MKKLLAALFALVAFPVFAQSDPNGAGGNKPAGGASASTLILPQWGQDKTLSPRGVYVLDPATLVWLSIGQFTTPADVWSPTGALLPANNLNDLASSSVADANLGLRVPNATGAWTFWVNASTSVASCSTFNCQPGSDSNNGLTVSTPWKTLQHAVTATAGGYDLTNGATINAACGVYNENVGLPPYVMTAPADKNVFITGCSASPGSNGATSTVVNGGSGKTFSATNSPQGWVLKNIYVSSSAPCLFQDYKSTIFWDGGTFGPCSIDVQSANPAAFGEFINHNYTIVGAHGAHVSAVNGGAIEWNGVSAVMQATPSFSAALEVSSNGGVIDETGFTSIIGGFTGARYNLYGRLIPFSTGTGTTTQNTTQYIGLSSISNSEINYFTNSMQANNVMGLYANSTASPGAGQSYILTLDLGGGATALTCTIASGSTACNDLIHSSTLSTPTVMDIKIVSSATASAAQISASVIAQ